MGLGHIGFDVCIRIWGPIIWILWPLPLVEYLRFHDLGSKWVEAFHVCFQLSIEARSWNLSERELLVDFSRDLYNLSLIACIGAEFDLGSSSLVLLMEELWTTLDYPPWSTCALLRMMKSLFGRLSFSYSCFGCDCIIGGCVFSAL